MSNEQNSTVSYASQPDLASASREGTQQTLSGHSVQDEVRFSMNLKPSEALRPLLESSLGPVRSQDLLDTLEVPADLPASRTHRVERSQIALVLAFLLFDDVCRRVPVAQAYAQDARRAGRKLLFDHGALRTVAAVCGDLPQGAEAFARILEPLGYRRTALYPLDRLGMTGYAYTHVDLPETIPQYFVSELHPERFSAPFQEAVDRVVGTSRDPLPTEAHQLLDQLERTGSLGLAQARKLLPWLVACFDRQHGTVTLADYETLLAESSEMAWIATEGNAFNHATDRVADVHAEAERQKALGRPMKKQVEISASGRVAQTAFRAGKVERWFEDAEGYMVSKVVPGSFHELITRQTLPDGRLDLAFDTGNAQSIFQMTAVRRA